MKKKLLLPVLILALICSLCTFAACNAGISGSGTSDDDSGNVINSSSTDKHHHSYYDYVVDPTCTEQGFTEHVCYDCGDSYIDDYVDAIGHDYSAWITEEPATCTNDGMLGYYFCYNCHNYFDKNHNKLESLVIEAKGHDYENGFCKNCGRDINSPSEGLAYSFNSYGMSCTITGIGTCIDTYIVIPDSIDGYTVTAIDEKAFSRNGKLVSVTISENVTSIGNYAFYGCNSLTSVAIGENVTSIGSSAFYDCTALTEINYNAINCADLRYDSSVFYKAGQRGSGIKVTIGKNVQNIPAYLFYPDWNSSYSPKITSVVFEEGSVCESIGSCAFYGCINLTSITIPDNVTSIGSSAFDGCSSLTSVTIPENVTSIGGKAFYNCTALTKINYNAINCADLSDYNNVFSKAGQSGDGIKVTIGKNVKSIPTYLFYPYSYDSSYSPKITSVVFEEGSVCESIGSYAFSGYAFSGCSNLTSITIPDNVTTIGSYAFYNCTALTEINYNATNCADLSENNYVFSYAGQSGDGIKVTIGKKVENIPAYLFCPSSYYYSSSPKITSVVFEEGSVCESIGSCAFDDCTALNKVYITDISKWCSIAFGNEYSNPLYYAKNLYINNEIISDIISGDVVIENGATSIPDYTFYNCSGLTSITIPDSVTSIGSNAFNGCTTLNKVSVTNISKWCSIAFGNEYSNPLYYAKNLYINNEIISDIISGDVVIENGATSIPDYTFYNCSGLTSTTIPDSVKHIGSSAFSGCSSLNKITVSEQNDYYCSISGILYNKNKTKLIFIPSSISGSVIIPDGIMEIPYFAFYNCNNLTSITIPESVTSIGFDAFFNCTALTEINYNAANCTDSSYNNCIFYNAGQSGDGIKVTIGKNVKNIPAYLFCPSSYYYSSSPKITSVVFEEGSVCESIGSCAFEDCTALNYIIVH